MKALPFILVFSFCASVAQTIHPITRIAFGSCSNEELQDQMWTEIINQKPQLCVWLGDNIYGDTHDMALMRAQYDHQKSDPEYLQLLKASQVIGTWDDHDYGQNDGGKFYSKKKESKEEFLRFMDVPANEPMRKHEGVYNSHVYGKGKKQVKIILLDLRYFRDTTIKSTTPGRRYEPNPEGDMLGEAQWAWFENEIRNSKAAVHIIGSSIQFISNDHGYEKWGNFPKSRQRMLDLLVKYKIKRPFIISGDRHIAEVSKMDVPGLPYPLYDITSSGLTHTWTGGMWGEENQLRVGKLIIQKNFGMILLDWSGKEPIITIEIRGKNDSLWDEPTIIR